MRKSQRFFIKVLILNCFNIYINDLKLHRCSRSCLNNKKRKRREVTRDQVEHGESTTKTVLTGGPILITEEKQNIGGKSLRLLL